jgi:hypothetical protein
MDNRITLDLEGQIFKINKETLLRIPYFINVFETSPPNTNEIIYLDRSAKAFSYVLQWARYDNYNFPIKYKHDYDFYLLECNNLYDPVSVICNKIELSETQLSNKIKSSKYKLSDKIKSSETRLSNKIKSSESTLSNTIKSVKNKYRMN